MVDVKYRRKTKRLISLEEIKRHADRLGGLPLIRRGNRLSIMPVDKPHWDFLLSLEKRSDDNK
jgi:predicted RNA-binding protein with PUA-like domain